MAVCRLVCNEKQNKYVINACNYDLNKLSFGFWVVRPMLLMKNESVSLLSFHFSLIHIVQALLMYVFLWLIMKMNGCQYGAYISRKYASVQYIDEKKICQWKVEASIRRSNKKRRRRRNSSDALITYNVFFQLLIVFPQNMAQILSRTNSNTLNRKSKKPPDDLRNWIDKQKTKQKKKEEKDEPTKK